MRAVIKYFDSYKRVRPDIKWTFADILNGKYVASEFKSDKPFIFNDERSGITATAMTQGKRTSRYPQWGMKDRNLKICEISEILKMSFGMEKMLAWWLPRGPQ